MPAEESTSPRDASWNSPRERCRAVLVSFEASRPFNRRTLPPAAALRDHLVGHWMVSGTLGGKQTTHDADARWVLNREYIEFREVSRERRADGAPAYEHFGIGWCGRGDLNPHWVAPTSS
jgi:hypothetical protein